MDESIEIFAIFMSGLIKKVNSKIDAEQTQTILVEMLNRMESEAGLDLDDADEYGQRILNTQHAPSVLN